MKSTLILVGVLASIGTAQPHSPHRHVHRHPAANADAVDKRDVETVWITQWETVSMTESIGQSNTQFWYPDMEPSPPAASWYPNMEASPSPASLDTSTPTYSIPSVSTPASSGAPTNAADFFDSSKSATQPPSSIPPSPTIPPVVDVPPTTLSPVISSAAPPTTLSSAAPPASTGPSGGGGSGGYPLSGDLTYYTLGVGSCGTDDTGKDDSVHVVAVAVGLMDATWTGNPNANPNCGRTVEISYGGVTAQATVVDTCEGCSGNSLDASTGLFKVFSDESAGRLTGMQWKWLS